MPAFTHRTLHAVRIEPSQSYSRTFDGYNAQPTIVPAGTPGTIVYHGVIGGEQCVEFVCRFFTCNLLARHPTQVCRIDWPAEREAEAHADLNHLAQVEAA